MIQAPAARVAAAAASARRLRRDDEEVMPDSLRKARMLQNKAAPRLFL
jgi:hypothetical protein